LSHEDQKRSDYRTNMSYPIWYRKLSDKPGRREWNRAVTRDLSGGGASFRIIDTLHVAKKPGELLEIQIVIPPKPVFVIGEVIRVFEDDRGRRFVAVKFASIEQHEKDRIVRAVLSEGLGRP